MEEIISKVCFKCGETKNLSCFYKHPQMADGHVNKCKECNKKDVRDNRESKVEYYRAYDIERGSRKTAEDCRLYRENNPKKYNAHSLVGTALKSGVLVKSPCEVCGEIYVHGHHKDYDKPLEVSWLCPEHHALWHKDYGEGINAH